MILNDRQITELAKQGMIEPFLEERLQPFGYDMTLSTKFRVFCGDRKKNYREDYILDPFNVREKDFENFEGDTCIVPEHSFALGVSLEYFRIPNDVVGQCLGRSSYARMGIIPNVTPLEAGWEGYVTIEISNGAGLPCKVYANKGISQVQFHRGEMPLRNYVQKGGRYQNQEGITLTKGI